MKNVTTASFLLTCCILAGCLLGSCSSGQKKEKEFYEAIDNDNLSEAKSVLREMDGSEKYKCAEVLVEEYIDAGEVQEAVNVYERITPNHCSTYEMQYESLHGHDGYETRVTKLLYQALIENGEFDKAWSYHPLDYQDENYPGNAKCYFSYLSDVLVHLCQTGRQPEAQQFLDTKGLWFQKNVDNSEWVEDYAQYTYRNMIGQLQSILNNNYISSPPASDSGPGGNTGKTTLLERRTAYPIYLMPGDVLHYEVEAQQAVSVRICNADAQSVLRRYSRKAVSDSLKIDYAAIYLLEIDPGKGRQYVTSSLTFTPAPGTPAARPRVSSEQVACAKGDFGAVAVEGISMKNVFKEPRKFTLRGQIKSAFSGTSRAIVAVQVPKGATDVSTPCASPPASSPLPKTASSTKTSCSLTGVSTSSAYRCMREAARRASSPRCWTTTAPSVRKTRTATSMYSATKRTRGASRTARASLP